MRQFPQTIQLLNDSRQTLERVLADNASKTAVVTLKRCVSDFELAQVMQPVSALKDSVEKAVEALGRLAPLGLFRIYATDALGRDLPSRLPDDGVEPWKAVFKELRARAEEVRDSTQSLTTFLKIIRALPNTIKAEITNCDPEALPRISAESDRLGAAVGKLLILLDGFKSASRPESA